MESQREFAGLEWVDKFIDQDGCWLNIEGESLKPSELSSDECEKFLDFIKNYKNDFFQTSHLRDEMNAPDFPYCGVMGVYHSDKRFLFYFRKEAKESVTWGGVPYKKEKIVPKGGRVEPRKSFESWEDLRKNEAEHFSKFDKGVFEVIQSYLKL